MARTFQTSSSRDGSVVFRTRRSSHLFFSCVSLLFLQCNVFLVIRVFFSLSIFLSSPSTELRYLSIKQKMTFFFSLSLSLFPLVFCSLLSFPLRNLIFAYLFFFLFSPSSLSPMCSFFLGLSFLFLFFSPCSLFYFFRHTVSLFHCACIVFLFPCSIFYSLSRFRLLLLRLFIGFYPSLWPHVIIQ